MSDTTVNPNFGLCECGCGERTPIATRSDARTGAIKGMPLRFKLGHGRKTKMTLAECMAVARNEGVTGKDAWRAFAKSDRNTMDAPFKPELVFKSEWPGWTVFRGATILSLEDAMKHLHGLHPRLKGADEYLIYWQSLKEPRNLPQSPRDYYGGEAFNRIGGMPGYLGYERRPGHMCNEEFLPFPVARDIVRAKKFTGRSAFFDWVRKENPPGIPWCPDTCVQWENEWLGYWDFLGCEEPKRRDLRGERVAAAQDLVAIQKEFANSGLSFANLSHNLAMIFAPTQAYRDALRHAALRAPRLTDALDMLASNPEAVLARLENAANLEDDVEDENESLPHDPGTNNTTVHTRPPRIENVHAADFLPPNATEEQRQQAIAAGLHEFRTALLSGKTLNEGLPHLKVLLESNPEGPVFRQMRDTMRAEVEALKNIRCAEWQMKKNGVSQLPNVMQLYTALRIRDTGSFGNWSTFGSGKTAAAGLASYVINSQLTVVVAANSNISQWKMELEGDGKREGNFRGANVVLMDEDFNTAKVKRGRGQFLVINYEKFGGADSRELVDFIISKRPDMLVFDETQLVKYRSGIESKRRRAIMDLRLQLRDAGVKCLVQTGTPVINQLSEGESILELMLGVEDLGMNTRSTAINAMEMHRQFYRHGLRAVPPSPVQVKYISRRVRHDELLPLLPCDGEDYLRFEPLLLLAKLDAVRDDIRPGVVLYSNFVEFEQFADRIQQFVEGLGFTCAQYTGPVGRTDRNDNQAKFMRGEVDVLLSSKSLSLGVDGLQQISNRLIFLNLPWTAAEYGQTVGRVARQGSIFDVVEVITPIIEVSVGGEIFSWDEIREAALKTKRDLGNAVLDGELPLTDNFDPRILVRDVMTRLNELKAKQPELAGA